MLMSKNMNTGGCQCRAITYIVSKSKLVSYICHCIECKRQSTSAFAISVPLSSADIKVEGHLKSYNRKAFSGATTTCYFCGICGTRIYHQSSTSKSALTLKGGTLDNSYELSPKAHLWVKRKVNWISFPTNCETYDTQPDNLKEWRSKLVLNNF